MRPGIRLDAWATANLGDQVQSPDSAGEALIPGWCARGLSIMMVNDRPMVREAFFYPPAPPPDLALPDSAAGDPINSCTLGMLRLSVPANDTAAKGSAEADSLAAIVGIAFGRAERRPVGFARSAFWSRTARFKRNDVVVFTAYEALPPREGDSLRHRLVAVGFLPNAGLADDGTPLSPGPFTPADSVPLDTALAWAGLDSAPPATAAALARWVSAAASLPPQRRAAALYAADLVLERNLCAWNICENPADSLLRPLRTAGAEFTWSALFGRWASHRAWTQQARVLDRDSPLGRRILLAQMAAGFDFTGMCARGPEAFRAVIDNGERYLARVPDSPIAADVHFLIGEAYRDIVALAAGAAGVYADQSRYQEQSAEAREQAIAHYRAALAAGPSSPTAQAAWRRAWWLLAGLSPADTRFYCIYD